MLNWQSIDTVFLDMDGTLLDLHFDNHFWMEHLPLRYGEKHGLDLQQAKDELMPRYAAKRGTLDWYCLDYWGRELDMDIPALKREVAHLIRVHAHVDDFLRALRAAGKRMVLLTNAHGDSVSLKMEVTELAPRFDRIVSTHDVGLAKEQAGFWAELHAREAYQAERSLMVDDNLDVLLAAKQQGIAFQLAMRWPDTQADARDIDEFPAIMDFRAVMPVFSST